LVLGVYPPLDLHAPPMLTSGGTFLIVLAILDIDPFKIGITFFYIRLYNSRLLFLNQPNEKFLNS